jgi:protein O-mannosyl-transferase
MSARSSTKRSLPPNKQSSKALPQPAFRQKPQRHAHWIYGGLLLITFAVYAQVRHFDFVNYDDPEYVAGNPHVQRGLTGSGLAWAFTSGDSANWFPLTRISHMADVQLFGLDRGMHHLVNVVLHALAALLLFAFLNRATKAQWPSAFVAFIFALHPLHVESVAWVAERKDVLCGVFWFLTLWAYTRYAERPDLSRYFLVLVSFCLGLLSKPMIVTLPFALVLLDIWPLRRDIRKAFREKIPLLTLSAIAAVITYFVQQNSRAVKSFPLELRTENALVSYVIYILRTFWPSKLAVFYPYPVEVPAWEAVLSALVLVGVTVAVLQVFRSRTYLAAGWFWYLGTLVPVIGIVQVGAQARADRYTYIPMVGLLIMLAWGAADAVEIWPRLKPVIATAAAAACGCCVVLTFMQLGYWNNSESLFAHALEVTQRNYVAHHNLGLAIADQPGRMPEAIAHYRAALAILPDSVEARSDLGSALAKTGHLKEAIAEYETALRIAPDCTICKNNLALAKDQMAQAYFQDGLALAKGGHAQEAIVQFEAALHLEPDYAEAHNDLGVALGSLGRTTEAIEEFRTAVRIRPDYEDARYNLNAALNSNKNSKR